MKDGGNGEGRVLFPGVSYDYGAVAPPGAILFTAGACPLDAAGDVVRPDDHVVQAGVALENLITVLRLHGAGPEHLVRTTIHVVGDRDDVVRVWRVIVAGLAPYRPPSTLLGISALGYERQLVDIDGIAALPA